jgi:hypothetical protein
VSVTASRLVTAILIVAAVTTGVAQPAASTVSPRAQFTVQSEEGDTVGGGGSYRLKTPATHFDDASYPLAIGFDITGPDADVWGLQLVSPTGEPLHLGTYGGLVVAHNWEVCLISTQGFLTVERLRFSRRGRLLTLVADFSQVCGENGLGLTGHISYMA